MDDSNLLRAYTPPPYVIRYTNRDGTGFISSDGSGAFDKAIHWPSQHSPFLLAHAMQIAADLEGNPREETYTVILAGQLLHGIWTTSCRENRFQTPLHLIKSVRPADNFLDADRDEFASANLVKLNERLVMHSLATRYLSASECEVLAERGVGAAPGWYAFRHDFGGMVDGIGPYRSFVNVLLDADQLVADIAGDYLSTIPQPAPRRVAALSMS